MSELNFERHQVVPVFIQEQWLSFEQIVDFFINFTKKQQTCPEGTSIEIEAKLGSISFTNDHQ